MQERKEEVLEIYSDERLTEFAEGEAELGSHLKLIKWRLQMTNKENKKKTKKIVYYLHP